MSTAGVGDAYKENYKDYYKKDASSWRRIGAVAKADNILRLCHSLPHETILEIGAGEGSILQRLSELEFGAELHALEISTSGVDAIRARNIPRLVDCRIFDGYNTPFEDGAFDLVVLSHVVEHVEHPRHLIYEASRIGKSVFIEVPLEDTVRMSPDFVFTKVGHINFYTPKTIRHLVQSCNLKILAQLTTNPPKDSYLFQKGFRGAINFHIKDLLLKFFPRLATEVFTYHGALVCRKSDNSPG